MSSYSEKSAQGRRSMEGRWGPRRAERLAAGKPATVREELGVKRDRFSDLQEDEYWQEAAERAGLIPDDATSTQRRRIAYAYAQAVKHLIAARAAANVAGKPSEKEGVTAYFEAERERLRKAEAADLRRASEHKRLREAMEAKLAELYSRRDRPE